MSSSPIMHQADCLSFSASLPGPCDCSAITALNVSASIAADQRWTIRRPARVDYKPRPDITAFEVARLMPILPRLGLMMYPENHIPADLMRHFDIGQPA